MQEMDSPPQFWYDCIKDFESRSWGVTSVRSGEYDFRVRFICGFTLAFMLLSFWLWQSWSGVEGGTGRLGRIRRRKGCGLPDWFRWDCRKRMWVRDDKEAEHYIFVVSAHRKEEKE